MTVRERLMQELDALTEAELRQVQEYVSFLRSQFRVSGLASGEHQWAAVYGEFAEEDRRLSEEGLSDYVEGLCQEDHR